ncbi:anthranilate synthase component II [Staphylococcus simulans]|uniref:anthranilate synthase component II n=1 Tax=Staphylococcus simulans TaxID=1286 RepID=UPI000D1F830A|nr:aminodeoxychorismate/anthranilate synthase component II [Staphylococcus simulans]MDY5059930.1 aminodeoxychorismate/anthranilate synthase component II [Staphylococcus simulans]PTJ20943.1 aminodeoxychorismate/anthranilate synthase component II [Staphylococcus simulans]
MIIMIDNKDSFTYNLVDYLKTESNEDVRVIDVDDVNIEALKTMQPHAIVISPGPGSPSDYPILHDVINNFEDSVPILGVCLGFQLMVEHYGGAIIHSSRPVHGHTTLITTNEQGIFAGLPKQFYVMRYHSLCADALRMPSELEVTAYNEEQIVMAVAHKSYPIYGVQYHPESILSEYGHAQIRLFLQQAGENIARAL